MSPKAHWKLFTVLLDKGPGQVAYALGEWDGKPRLGFRWNGTDDNPIGNPQSRGLPTWTMLDEDMHLAIIQQLPEDKQTIMCSILGITIPPMVEFKVAVHPSGRHTLMARASGQRMFEDGQGDLLANDDAGGFYKAVCEEIRRHLHMGTKVVLGEL
ncbi:hypothetical protein [Methylobacterium oryzihabitans]|uniref:Uncharacterized protein n=1 Tax=Methylobacterium oryzihabitans TaxID=2499852 RepID=A0A437P7W8_9HYPH|nr:hypothetical protein [Methylobacterium oryzihabitans]RVU18351.1 hypothetical protein EOE48_10645 [Methylobacterium oryzihabitans]